MTPGRHRLAVGALAVTLLVGCSDADRAAFARLLTRLRRIPGRHDGARWEADDIND